MRMFPFFFGASDVFVEALLGGMSASSSDGMWSLTFTAVDSDVALAVICPA